MQLTPAADLCPIRLDLHRQVDRLTKLANVLELFVVTKSYADAPHAGLRALVA